MASVAHAQADRRLAHLGFAMLIVGALAAVLFLIANTAWPGHTDIALGLASLAIAAFPPIDQFLEIQEVTVHLSGLPRKRPATLEQFSIPWYVLLAYGATLLFMLHLVTSALYSLGDFLTNTNVSLHDYEVFFNAGAAMVIQEPPAIPLVILPAIGMFFLGRWIAIRSSRYALPVVIAVAFLGHCFALITGAIMSGDSGWRPLMDMSSTTSAALNDIPAMNTLGGLLWWVIPTGATFAVVGIAGWWRGNSQRLMRYADYLLNRLQSDTRLVAVSILYDAASDQVSNLSAR